MTKLITALKRTLGERGYTEPRPHFHQGTSADNVEVCHDDACARPRLMTIPFPAP